MKKTREIAKIFLVFIFVLTLVILFKPQEKVKLKEGVVILNDKSI